jgi:hypothetical protein
VPSSPPSYLFSSEGCSREIYTIARLGLTLLTQGPRDRFTLGGGGTWLGADGQPTSAHTGAKATRSVRVPAGASAAITAAATACPAEPPHPVPLTSYRYPLPIVAPCHRPAGFHLLGRVIGWLRHLEKLVVVASCLHHLHFLATGSYRGIVERLLR